MNLNITADRVYRKLSLTPAGTYELGPVDTKAFEKAQLVGERMEKALTPLPNDVSLVSLAISMARIAESLETLEQLAYRRYKRDKLPIWKKLTEKEDE